MFRILPGIPQAVATVIVQDYLDEFAAACRALSGQSSGPKPSADVKFAGDGHEAVFDMPGSRTPKRV